MSSGASRRCPTSSADSEPPGTAALRLPLLNSRSVQGLSRRLHHFHRRCHRLRLQVDRLLVPRSLPARLQLWLIARWWSLRPWWSTGGSWWSRRLQWWSCAGWLSWSRPRLSTSTSEWWTPWSTTWSAVSGRPEPRIGHQSPVRRVGRWWATWCLPELWWSPPPWTTERLRSPPRSARFRAAGARREHRGKPEQQAVLVCSIRTLPTQARQRTTRCTATGEDAGLDSISVRRDPYVEQVDLTTLVAQ